MKFIEIGEGGHVDGLRVAKNIIVVDDISSVHTFISVGKNGRITNLDAEGNEVHTPASYAEKLTDDRAEFFSRLDEMNASIESIEDDMQKQKVKVLLKEAQSLGITPKDEWSFQTILKSTFEIAKNTGAAVLASCITAYFGTP